jgi:1,4-alpha-glucan branching enzyme
MQMQKMVRQPSRPHVDVDRMIELDPTLKPYKRQLQRRAAHYKRFHDRIEREGGLLGPISQGHHYFGLNRGERDGEPGVWYREWAPGADYLSLVGDFNGWDREANPLTKDEWGVWSLFLPDSEYRDRLTHGSRIKVHVRAANGWLDRIPAYIRRVVQEEGDPHYVGQYWCPPEPYQWRHKAPRRPAAPRVYESHVGMAQEEGKVGSFDEFRENVLPRIAELGYNTIQFMAIQEHPYYGSFGYQVSNFFAVSSRFGTPEQLKALVDAAHGMGLLVIMDLVHSHSVKNVHEGLNTFDGTSYQYFHAGPRGEHPQWDSLLFDYSKHEVQRFLLSNVRYWLEEFNFDGFRFDGVTSMMYKDHGLGKVFTGYDDYFSENTDLDAVSYLTLATETAHAVDEQAMCVAEDMSGMPGLCRPVREGGMGFDYRLAMGVPDYWVNVLKARSDEQWDLWEMYHRLTDRRVGEPHIGYVESHDQALVGDKTVAFWLMDQEMYWSMSKFTPSLIVDRGIALHKMIRLVTFSLAGEGYLTFMGNEFGHPEWIDFPRPGNDYSHQYARRQWSLAERDDLRYKGLAEFDKAMLELDERYGALSDERIDQLAAHQEEKQLVYRRGRLVFVFNFHPTESYEGLRIPLPENTDYRLILDTDRPEFEGHGRVELEMTYPVQDVPMYGRTQSLQLYLPARSAQVLAPTNL